MKAKATPTAVKIYNIQAEQDRYSLTFGRMNIVIVIVAAYVFAVGVLKAHAEAEEDVGMSAVRLSRRAIRVYLLGPRYINVYCHCISNIIIFM